MFAYCENSPVNNGDPLGYGTFTAGWSIQDYYNEVGTPTENAKKKYNSKTINIVENEIGNAPNKLNVTLYPASGLIHVENSYMINNPIEQKAIIKTIMNSESYDSTKYSTSVETMLMEWSGHNFVYRTASCSKLMYKFYQYRGYDTPIESTSGVDFRLSLEPSQLRNYKIVTLGGRIHW